MFSTEKQSGRVFVSLFVLWLCVLLPAPVLAEVRWRSGHVSAPERMQPARLNQALAQLAARPDQSRVVVHLAGPLGPGDRATLEANGVRLLSYLGGNAYFATLTADARPSRIAQMPTVAAVAAIDPADKLHPDLERGIARPWSIVPAAASGLDEADDGTTVAVYVLFHRDFDLGGGAANLIARHGGRLVSEITAIQGAVAHLPLRNVAQLAADDDVMYVEPPLPALEVLNDGNRALTGVDIVNTAPYNLDGSGVTVMVYDGGQVFAHSDLDGRLTIGASDTDDISDHATHVACTIAGDGGLLSGMAPAAEIVSYGFEQEGGLQQGFLYTDPGDMLDDYTEASSLYGVVMSNNSIGANVASNGYPCSWEGDYGTAGALIDELVRGALGEPFRIVWANGNERGSNNCGTSYFSTGPPSCAKNSMTVGAVNSNDDSVTDFTSWGPCDDGRLKPDVSAPGCQSNGDDGVNSCSSSGGYTTKCGTSMASPTAAGVSALLLQQFRDSFPGRPDFRNSLLRAVLAHTAVDLGNPGPDYQTGYGSIRAKPAVDLITTERFIEDAVSHGQVYNFTVGVFLGNTNVKITLAWDDPSGTPNVDPVLVNDLDLRIIGPDQTVHYPWTLDPDNPGDPAVQTVRDDTNNIEQVLIPSAAPGTYIVEVKGFNIAEGSEQPFGLVSNQIPQFCTNEPTFDGVTGVTPGASCGEIDVTWSPGSTNCVPAGSITYNLYRATDPGSLGTPSTLVQQGIATTSATDGGLDPGTTYHYLVRADDSFSGEDSNTVSLSAAATIGTDSGAPLFAGLDLATAGAECGEITLDWQAAVETCSVPVRYDVFRSGDPGFTPGPENLIATTYATDFIDTSITPGAAQTYVVRAADAAGNAETNNVHRSATPTAFDLEVVTTDFEQNDQGWSVVAPNDASAGTWEWGDPQGTAYQPDDDASNPGSNCWITGLSPNPSNGDVDDGQTTLLSVAYDVTAASTPSIGYMRWFTNDQGGSPGDPTDTLRVDVSDDDGQSWTLLEEVGAGTPLAWTPVVLPLPVSPTDEVRVRMTVSDLGAGSLVEAGVDEFRLFDAGQQCFSCDGPPVQDLCEVTVELDRDDVTVSWTGGQAGARAVIYGITGCDTADRVKLGTTTESAFVHEAAALTAENFNYRVTFVDACGNEQPFCGATDCP